MCINVAAAAAKSLQLCPTLCNPIDSSPTRLPCPWDSQGKNTGVGCHFLLQCMKAKSEREVAQSCLTLSDPMDCSPPGSSIHGIFQARVLARPLSLLQRGLAPRSKGKAREELRPARRQSRLPHSRSLLLPGRER